MSLLQLLRMANQTAAALVSERTGYTATQVAVLLTLRVQGNSSQADLVRATGIDRSTLSEVLRRLQAASLVAIHLNDADRREHVVRLTEGGQRIAVQLAADADVVESGLLARVSASGRNHLLRGLELVARGVA
jgi:DNA-binding MarR family transcriptional regulator